MSNRQPRYNEPWGWDATCDIYDNVSYLLGNMNHYKISERIVACVNFCAGWSNEELNEMKMKGWKICTKEFIELTKEVHAENERLKEENEKLRNKGAGPN